MSTLRIIFAGSGEFGLPTLRALRDAGHEIVQVFSQPDRPAGRGRKLTPTPIAQFAIEQNLPVIRTANINAEPLPAADAMVVIAFGQKIADGVVSHPRFGSVNLHSSRLPKFRGAAPINAAILAGETITGNSIIRLAQKMDAGAILAQSSLNIGELETAGELHDRLAEDGAPLMLGLLEALAERRAIETPQDESLASLAPKMSRDSARLDWSLASNEIARRIRGLYPWPGCRVRLVDAQQNEVDRLTLVRARAVNQTQTPVSERSREDPDHGCDPEISASSRVRSEAASERTSEQPGTIRADLSIATGAGAIDIVELQPEGKRPMSLAAYRNGHPWEAGMRLESI